MARNPMRIRLDNLFYSLVVLCFTSGAFAQTAEEDLFFNAAVNAFKDAAYERAETQFAEFIRKYPTSTRLSEAILFQARAALTQHKHQEAATLLKTNQSRAGALADQYQFFLAHAYLDVTNYQAAVDAFAKLAKEFPASVRLLEASYDEAWARYKLGQLDRVVELLRNPDGIFQREAPAKMHEEFVVSGFILLAEVLLEQKSYAAARESLDRLANATLNPELSWKRQYLLIRLQVANRELEAASSDVTNLLTLAALAGPVRQAESISLQGQIAEQMTNFDLAIQAYTNNLTATTPPDYRRNALLKVVQLSLAQDKLIETAQRLEAFCAQNPGDPNVDVALLTLGEIHLKQHQQWLATNKNGSLPPAAEETNSFLAQAASSFDRLLTNAPQTALFGQAQLGLGWCYWEQRKLSESLVAFKLAAERLPRGEAQAIARFKLGDNFFLQKDYTNALENYRRVLDGYSGTPGIRSDIVEQSLYQSLRASLEIQDVATATAAMRKILALSPGGTYAERSQLFLGHSLLDLRHPAAARAIFNQFIERCPASPLLAEVAFAVARSYVMEKNWEDALKVYDTWLHQYATNALAPQAEFNRAWVNYLAGRETNALRLFTNFVAQFTTNELAPYAKNWVADYYYRQGAFTHAELQYQQLLTNAPPASLANEARMMAGRAAFARQAYTMAEKYFQSIINDNSATNHWPEALYALGDTILMTGNEATNQVRKFEEAKDAFSKIPQLFPAHPLVPYAWGRMGDCYLQMGSLEVKSYDAALDAYQRVLAPAGHVELAARCQAEFGWGKVLEKQAHLPSKTPAEKVELLKSALAHYLNIFEGKTLLPGEEMDPFWMKEAGFAAANLAEELKEWAIAVNLYRRLQDSFPIFRATLEKRADKARGLMRAEKL